MRDAASETPVRLDIDTILALGEQMMPDVTTMSAAEARAVLAAVPARPGPDVATVADVEIDDQVTGRHYAPIAAERGPLVVYFHGGGFTVGNVDSYDGTARRLADALHLPLLSVEYRLAPEHKFPAAVDDAWVALTWAASSPLGERGLVVAGDSAGANLAAVVARRAAEEGIDVRHQLLLYPCFDPACSLGSHQRPDSDTAFLSRDAIAWYWRQYLDDADVSLDPDGGTTDVRIDPRHGRLPAGLAQATIVLAGRDPLHDEGADYAVKLAAGGVAVTTFDYPTLFHGFAGFAALNDDAAAAFGEVVDSVGAALGGAEGA